MRRRRRGRRSGAGYSLIELLIAFAVMVEIMVVVYVLFEFNNRVSRVQTQTAEMQQSLRVAQHDLVRLVRMAGRGGLPEELALEIVQNAEGGDLEIAGEEIVEPGTDVLTVRGVLSSPLYQVNAADTQTFVLTGDPPQTGTLLIDSKSPGGIPQSLDALENAPAGDALLLVSPVDDSIFFIAEISTVSVEDFDVDGDGSVEDGERRAEIELDIGDGSGANIGSYRTLSGGSFPTNLSAVAFAGILEEWRYYIRRDFAVPGLDSSEPAPKLARARMFPGTDKPHADDETNLDMTIAENMLELQVSLGYDLNENGRIDVTDTDGNPIPEKEDEWRWNAENENPADWSQARLFYVRINTLARTDRPDRKYQAELVEEIEDQSFDTDSPINGREARMHRRRLLQTVVDMRNL